MLFQNISVEEKNEKQIFSAKDFERQKMFSLFQYLTITGTKHNKTSQNERRVWVETLDITKGEERKTLDIRKGEER